ncbi:MAG TPA: PAS domain S-box protein, partial [Methanoregulaceae archaeon]|nr:PAS domain S-box protein [Methanoregulaceae archaeon]
QAEMELSRQHDELESAYNQLAAQELELKQKMNDIVISRFALQEIEEKYRILMENAGECIVIAQGDYIKFVNRSTVEVSGYNKEELLSRPFIEFFHPDDRVMITSYYQHWLRGDHLGCYTFHLVIKGGEVLIMEIRPVPILWNGEPATLNLILDITRQKKAEETLRESELFNRGLVENLPEYIIVYGKDGKINYTNSHTAMALGYSIEELVGASLLTFVSENYGDIVTSSLSDRLKGKEIPAYEIEIITKGGTTRSVIVKGKVIQNHNVPVILLVLVDITERKHAENAIRTTQSLLMEAMDLAHLANWEFNNQTRLFTFNDRFYELYGTTAEREGGYLMPADIYFREFIHPDDYCQINTDIKRIKDIPDSIAIFQKEHRIIRRDGEIRHIIVRTKRSIDKNSGIVTIHGVNQDITEVRRAEDQKRTTLHRLDRTISTLNDGFIIVSEEGKIEHVNQAFCDLYDLQDAPERLCGLLSDEIIKKIQNVYSSPAEVSTHIQEFITHGKPIYDYEITLRNGRIFVINYIPIIDDEGKRQGRVWYHHDITERKKTEEALAAANKKLKLLSDITRHDINNQLVMLRGYLDLLENEQPDASFCEYVKKIKTAEQSIASMIQFTNEYESIGIQAPIWQDCHTIVDIAAKMVPVENIELINDVPEKMEVFADPLVIKVFYNLMDNAIRYGGKITALRFAVQGSDDDIKIICEDDGEGIPAEEKERIFERKFGKNTGLGLFLSREILDITGITIHEAGEPGKGARFAIMVPNGMWRFVN